MSIDVHYIIEVFREICKRTLQSLLGEASGEAVLFLLRKNLGRDPSEVFWEDPGAVYREMERIFGIGAKVLINFLVTKINEKFDLNMNPEHFLDLMRSGDQHSVEEIRSFLAKIAELYKKGEGVSEGE
ncbi:MAG: hypothetical protein RMJ31_04530 [Nitrososphaerota archaeon]|nr:hypothetical protein [Nitrososphaerales archaeon]MDW8045021.1 hypothetical protein [Nitrososphaerota archaeon]